jgi:hypothetical protein
MQDPKGIAAQRASVIPPFAEAEFEVPDGRTLDRELSVMPGRSWPIHRRHGLVLPIAVVVGSVAPTVAEVDAASEGNVALTSSWTSDDDELLVMGAAQPYSLVEKNLSPG